MGATRDVSKTGVGRYRRAKSLRTPREGRVPGPPLRDHARPLPRHFDAWFPHNTGEGAQLIKGGSSYDIGRAFQTRFPVWQPGFTQHLIRDRADYESHVRYIDANPVSKGLAERPEEYQFCSAYGKYRLDPWPVASGAKAPSGAEP